MNFLIDIHLCLFLVGFGFLRRFYTVYDRTNKQIGFANPKVTNTTN